MAWSALAVVFVAGAVWSTFLALRDAPVGPPGHGMELRAFLPIVHGREVLYAGQDRYAAFDLLGADTHVPLVEFPDEKVSPNAEKPFDTGDAYSPIDFDSFNRGTLDRFVYVITSRGAWNSAGAAELQADREDGRLHPLGTNRADAARTPPAARGHRGRRPRPLRLAGDEDPVAQRRQGDPLRRNGGRAETDVVRTVDPAERRIELPDA